MRNKIKATMLEGDDILLLTNTQICRNQRIIENFYWGAIIRMKFLPTLEQAMLAAS